MSSPTEQPGSQAGSSHGDHLVNEVGAAAMNGSETVINPEGRPDYQPLAGEGAPIIPVTDPSIWSRLFPSGGEGETEIPDPVGVELDHFIIEERIRSGGMGAVFRARDVRMNRSVALKVMPPRQTGNAAAVRRFQNEAQAAAQLDHDNIARAYYIGEDKGLHFIAFEFVTGVNIAELIAQQGRLPVDDALNYTLQIASALVHTSERGVVHRDIKPSNIIITPKGRAKLVDMGLARNENRDASADLTVAGTTLGTFDYISPEQAKDPRAVDVRSDIYSLGCTLYHMLTGEAPYPGGTMLQKLLDHQGKDAPDPSAKNPYVSEDLSSVVRKMMASDPKRRYQTAEELMRDLMLVAGSMGLRSVNPEGLVWMSSTRPLSAPYWERHPPWMSAIAALIILVTAASLLPGTIAQPDNTELAGTIPEEDQPDTENQDPENPEESSGTVKVAQNTDQEQTLSPAENPAGLNPEIEKPVTRPAPVKNQDGKLVKQDLPPILTPKKFELRPSEFPGSRLGPEVEEDDVVAALTPPTSKSTKRDVAQRNAEPKTGTKTEAWRPPYLDPDRNPANDENRPFVVLGTGGASSRNYPSLEAACTDAIDGSKIELRFNGVRREETPIRIDGKRITIRAAAGYRPTIELAPERFPQTDIRDHFITVAGGVLELANINLSMTITDELAAERWSIFSLEHPESVHMEGVAITVRNQSRRRQISIIDINPSTAFDQTPIAVEQSSKPLRVELSGCLFRGSCDLFALRHQESAQLTIVNCLAALDDSGAILRSYGGIYEPDDDAEVELTLNHNTLLVGSALLEMNSETKPHKLLPVRVTATNNIISAFHPCPLVEITGQTITPLLRGLVEWTGKYNYYDRFEEFWRINAPTLDDSTNSLNFTEWQAWRTINEVDTHNDRINWLHEWRSLPVENLTTADIRLDPNAYNRAVDVGTATGQAAGADLKALPNPLYQR